MNELILLLLLGTLLAAAIIDVRTHRIPNWLTYSTMLLGLTYHGLGGFHGLLFSLKGLGMGMGLLILPYLLGGMGAGDTKMMGAIGSIVGAQGVFWAFLFTALVGGGYALILLAVNGYLRETVHRYGVILKAALLTRTLVYIPPPPREKSPPLCYGFAIGMGTAISMICL